MNHDELPFEEFLAARMKDRGFSIKKLSEATGIAPMHIENMLRGDFGGLPSAPYFRGYLLRIGKTLGFDGEEWWKKFRNGSAVSDSGPSDVLPKNRFVKKDAPKWLWLAVIVAVLLIIYLVIALPRILGTPSLTVVYPPESPFIASSTSITFQGTVRNASALYLSNGAGASSSEEIPIAPDGTWQKTVLLQNGLNAFELSAREFLGGETNATEQIIYEPVSGTPASSSTPSATSTNLK
jgi:cytoskeletal protein RodZ